MHLPLRRVSRYLGLGGPRIIEAPLAASRLSDLAEEIHARPPANTAIVLQAATDVMNSKFEYLNEQRTIPKPEWGTRYGSPLWSFQLQYFRFIEDLAWAYHWTGDTAFKKRLETLVESWVAAEKPVRSDAWAPYAVAQRLIHWSRAYLLVFKSISPGFAREWGNSIAQQTEYLHRHIEWELLGNHVIKNLTGIVHGSSLFNGKRFHRIRAQAFDHLWQQADEQVLNDGMHFERSPTYHADVLIDLLYAERLVTVLKHPISLALPQRINAMRDALAHFVRADGTLHLFNDAANDARLDARMLLPPAHSNENAVWALQDSGYFGCSTERCQFIIDCGEPGPAYQPGHGHCDLLSFELDVDGRPLIIDSGTSGYDADPLREYTRSTRAHNTVQVGEIEQQEFWGTFRIARRARVNTATIRQVDEAVVFEGSYSAYATRRIVHHRRVLVSDHTITVNDRIHGPAARVVRSFLHFHPRVRVTPKQDRIQLAFDASTATIKTTNIASIKVRTGETEPPQGWYAPEFGVRIPSATLEMIAADATQPFGYTIDLTIS